MFSFLKHNPRPSNQQQHSMTSAAEQRDAPPTTTTKGGGDDNDAHQAKPIPLVGSADLITEFFYYGLNQILYQRGIYSPETFKRYTKYGMTTLISTIDGVETYLQNVLKQMNVWLHKRSLRRVAVVIASVASNKVLERWVFDIVLEHEEAQHLVERGITPCTQSVPATTGSKQQTRIVAEIRALLTQITATVAILPLLDEACAFEVLIYTTEDTETPVKWNESSARTIPNAQQVQLRSFSTSVHNIDTNVSFAPPPSEEQLS